MTFSDPVSWLESVIGARADEFMPVEDSGTRIHVAAWRDQPDIGMAFYASVGLSAVPRRAGGVESRAELILSVRSSDRAWGLALGFVVAQARGRFGFEIGETIDFCERISSDSAMTGFLVVPQMMFPEDLTVAKLDEIEVEFRQLLPIHGVELVEIRKRGPGFFARQEPVVDDVRRAPVRFDVS